MSILDILVVAICCGAFALGFYLGKWSALREFNKIFTDTISDALAEAFKEEDQEDT